MAIITVSGKQVEIQAREVRFQDVETGLVRVVIPIGIWINLEEKSVSYEIRTKLVTPTGFEIGQEDRSTYQLDIPIKDVLSDGFNKPFMNDVFKDALQKWGIKAKQIFDSTGKLSVIE